MKYHLSPALSVPSDRALPASAQLHLRPWPGVVGIVSLLRLLLVDSCLWTAATLAALPLFASHAMHLPLDARPSAVIFLSGLLIYNLDHLADSLGETGSKDRWTRGIGRSALVALVLGSAAALAVLLWQAPSGVGRVVIAYGVVGALYGVRVMPPRRLSGQWTRPKDIPGLKNALVACSVVVAAVGLPLSYGTLPPGPLAAPVALFLWVLVMSDATICDVGDLRADLASKVPTLPALLGVSKTRSVVICLNLISICVFSWLYSGAMLAQHPEVLLSTLVAVIYSLFVTDRTPKQLLSLSLDGASFLPITLAMVIHGHLG